MTNTYQIQINLLTPNNAGGMTPTLILSDDGTTFICPDSIATLSDLMTVLTQTQAKVGALLTSETTATTTATAIAATVASGSGQIPPVAVTATTPVPVVTSATDPTSPPSVASTAPMGASLSPTGTIIGS